MHPRFSRRTVWDTTESALAAEVRAAREAGRSLVDLTVSNPTRCGLRFDANLLLAPLGNSAALAYDPDPRGLLSARAAVSAYYAAHGAHVAPEDLVLTTSTSEAYGFLFRLLCDSGDEVLAPVPSYPLLDFLADLEDVGLRPYPLFYDHGWWIDFAELERAIGPRTRAVLVIHPNNPTGHWTGDAERERLERLCAQHGLALIVDEVFLDYPLRLSGRSFATGYHSALTFVLSGISKICGLPQMKVAWTAALGPGAEKAMARLEVIADTFLSMNAPVQLALPIWLQEKRAMQEQILHRVRTNLAYLEAEGKRSGGQIEPLRSDAGWSAVVNLARCAGDVSCAERLVRERGVLTHPGSFYGMQDSRRLILSLLSPEFQQGIERLLEA